MLPLLTLTFRELWARKITLALFAVATLVWVLIAFALSLDVVEGSLAGMRIFGQEAQGEGLTLESIVVNVQSAVAGAAYFFGTLLGLFATASLLPDLLERGRVDLLLSKPLSRWRILAGHVVGVWAAVGVLALYLFGLVWLVLSIKTGIWSPRFLLAVPLTVLMFGVMYSVVTLLGVAARSSALALVVAYALIFASLILQLNDQIGPQLQPWARAIWATLYHLLPNFTEVSVAFAELAGSKPITVWGPLLESFAFGAVVYALAGWLLARKDF